MVCVTCGVYRGSLRLETASADDVPVTLAAQDRQGNAGATGGRPDATR